MSLRTARASNQVGPAMVSAVSTQVPLPGRRSAAEGVIVVAAAVVVGTAAEGGGAADPAVVVLGGAGGLSPPHAVSSPARLSSPAPRRLRRSNSPGPVSTRRTVRGTRPTAHSARGRRRSRRDGGGQG